MFLYLAVVLLAAGADADRIIEGTPAEEGEFPFIALLHAVRGNASGFRTVVIISTRWVMTGHMAVHVYVNGGVPELKPKESTIYYGISRFDRDKLSEYPQCKIKKLQVEDSNWPAFLKTATDIDVSKPNVAIAKIMSHTPYGTVDGRLVGFGSGDGRLSYAVITCNYYCKHFPDNKVKNYFSDKRFVCPRGEQFTPMGDGDGGAPLLLTVDGKEFFVAGLLRNIKLAFIEVFGTLLTHIRTSDRLEIIRRVVPDVQVVDVKRRRK